MCAKRTNVSQTGQAALEVATNHELRRSYERGASLFCLACLDFRAYAGALDSYIVFANGDTGDGIGFDMSNCEIGAINTHMGDGTDSNGDLQVGHLPQGMPSQDAIFSDANKTTTPEMPEAGVGLDEDAAITTADHEQDQGLMVSNSNLHIFDVDNGCGD